MQTKSHHLKVRSAVFAGWLLMSGAAVAQSEPQGVLIQPPPLGTPLTPAQPIEFPQPVVPANGTPLQPVANLPALLPTLEPTEPMAAPALTQPTPPDTTTLANEETPLPRSEPSVPPLTLPPIPGLNSTPTVPTPPPAPMVHKTNFEEADKPKAVPTIVPQSAVPTPMTTSAPESVPTTKPEPKLDPKPTVAPEAPIVVAYKPAPTPTVPPAAGTPSSVGVAEQPKHAGVAEQNPHSSDFPLLAQWVPGLTLEMVVLGLCAATVVTWCGLMWLALGNFIANRRLKKVLRQLHKKSSGTVPSVPGQVFAFGPISAAEHEEAVKRAKEAAAYEELVRVSKGERLKPTPASTPSLHIAAPQHDAPMHIVRVS